MPRLIVLEVCAVKSSHRFRPKGCRCVPTVFRLLTPMYPWLSARARSCGSSWGEVRSSTCSTTPGRPCRLQPTCLGSLLSPPRHSRNALRGPPLTFRPSPTTPKPCLVPAVGCVRLPRQRHVHQDSHRVSQHCIFPFSFFQISLPSLVFYLPARSQRRHLSGSASCPPSEATRLRLCLNAAQGLAFLHALDPPIVHERLTSHNLLVGAREEDAPGTYTVGEGDR